MIVERSGASAGTAAGVQNGVTAISPEPVTLVLPATTYGGMPVAAKGGLKEQAPSRLGYNSALMVRAVASENRVTLPKFEDPIFLSANLSMTRDAKPAERPELTARTARGDSISSK